MLRGGKRLNNYLRRHLNNMKGYSLSDGDISNILKEKTQIITYPELSNYNDLNQLLGKSGRAIVLFLTDSNTNGHWISILRHNNHIEVFDSYGNEPSQWGKFLGGKMSVEPSQNISVLMKLLRTANMPVIYNNKAFQSKNYDVATCGRHVAVRCMMHRCDLGEYDKFISGCKGLSPDDLVTIITNEFIDK